MTITEVRDVLRILAGIGDKIRKFEIEALFRILVAHTGQRYTQMSANSIDVGTMLDALIKLSGSLNRVEVKTFYRISIDHGVCPVCAGCHTEIRDIHDFSWDHNKPKCFGGPDAVSNMQPMHRWCNNFKGNKLRPISTEAYLSHMKYTKTKILEEKKKRPQEEKIKKDLYPKRRHIRVNGWWDLNDFMNKYGK